MTSDRSDNDRRWGSRLTSAPIAEAVGRGMKLLCVVGSARRPPPLSSRLKVAVWSFSGGRGGLAQRPLPKPPHKETSPEPQGLRQCSPALCRRQPTISSWPEAWCVRRLKGQVKAREATQRQRTKENQALLPTENGCPIKGWPGHVPLPSLTMTRLLIVQQKMAP